MLEIYTLNQSEKWDEIVKTFNKYDIYYLSGYSKNFHIHGDGEPFLFYYFDDNGSAINVSFKRDISCDKSFKNKLEKNKFFDLSTPYGYGGWLISGDIDLNRLDCEYTQWCIDNQIISEVIRFHPIISNQDYVRNIYDVVDLGKTIAMELTSEDKIWSNMTTQARGKIKKARKYGVYIEHGINNDIMNEFKKIYNITMNKDNADDYYYFDDAFYNSILNDLNGYADIFYAMHEGKMIAATIVLKANGYLTYHFSGVLTDYRNLQGTNLMLYEAAIWGSKNGYETFHLGGGVGSKEDDLFIFKKSFNRYKDYQYSLGRKIFNQTVYNQLVKLREGEQLRENFFPLYRA